MESDESGVGTEQCPDCANEFDVANGKLMSDFQFHRLRGCPDV